MEAALTEDTINELSDLFTAFKWLQRLNIESKGITDVDGAKCRLLQHLQQTCGTGKTRPHNASSLVQEVLDHDRKQREELMGIYRHAESYMNRLPPARWRELDSSNPGYAERLLRNIRNLERSDCAILVAGEVSAGKSSLLNLLFGTNILPTSLLSCTSVICELKYGKEPYALAHSWDDKKPPERIPLDEKHASEKLSAYVHQKGERITKFPYKRIQIFWPFEVLKGGIVMVDSPGVGESTEMTKMVKNYLPDAFAFIYVINSSNAGGLQPDRLQDLLTELTHREEEGHAFDPRSAIFVCNKWDLVPSEEADPVKKDTLEKLRKCWKGIEERQLIFMSTTKAMKSLHESGYLTKDYAQLLDAIETLFPISLRCKLEVHYRWLAQLLRRSAFYLQAHIANETRTEEERKELTEHLHNQLDKLETESRRVQEELRKDLHERTGRACAELTTYLDDTTTRQRLAQWESNECPTGKDWDSLHEILISKVKKRIRREVNDWDNRNGVFSDIQSELIERFQQEFELMEDQLGIIEGGMVGSKQTRPTDNYEAIRQLKLEASVPMLTTNQKIALGIAAPLLIPLGVVVGLFALPVAGIRALKNKLEEMKLLREYQDNKTRVMGVVTDDVLASFIDNNNLTKLIREQLDSLSTNAEMMMKAIPKLIEADRMLLNKLQEQRAASEMALVEELLPMFHKCQSIQAMLDLYYVEQVRTYDTDISEIVHISPVPLSSGFFGDVYQATLQDTNGKRKDICLKYRKDHLSAKNISEVLIEEEYLRKMKQDNIIKCLGSSSKSEDKDYTTHIMLVLEPCTETLLSRITGSQARIPASYSDNPVWFRKSSKMLYGYALQIVNALCYLHERALVHRDLKPEVILLTSDEVIKLCDVGLTKPEGCISGFMYDFCNYSAPEVIEGREYNTAADVFSFIMILWELWYGKRVHDSITSQHSGTCESAVRAGIRPLLTEAIAPDEDLRDLFSRGWDHNIQTRPTALECIYFFQGKLATSNTTNYESFDTISLS